LYRILALVQERENGFPYTRAFLKSPHPLTPSMTPPKPLVKCGKGVMNFNSGASFEGLWEDNRFQGEGVYTWADNRRYAF